MGESTKKKKKRKREESAEKTEGEPGKYWLLKTEPKEWSWEDHRSNGGISRWDGVKNRQAQNNMKSMTPGDRCFFYHSGPSERRIVGVVEVSKPWYVLDGGDEGAVDVRSVGELQSPIDLKDIKADPSMQGFTLVRQPRLSVVPVSEGIWNRLWEMGGGIDAAETVAASAAE